MRRLAFVVCAFLLCAACSEPPQKEIDMAQVAIENARDAGAEEYAKESYTAATVSLRAAREAVAQGDYRVALSRALDARERAQEAAKLTTDGKARERRESEAAVGTIAGALQELQQKIKTAEAAGVPARDLKPARTVVDSAEAALQKARAALSEGRYGNAVVALETTGSEISEQSRALDEQIAARFPRASKRRR